MRDYVTLTGDEEADMAVIASIYEGREGLYPKLAAPIKLGPRNAREQA